ncbi:MAG TPA: hypothetical protein VGF76_10645 [Polyangiaceae bacterium]
MDRRQSLGLLGAFLTGVAWSKAGAATTARAISLPSLVARSTRIVRGSPLEASATFETIGDTRHIVTYTRLRVDELIHGGPSDSELWVRTLGGRKDKLGEIVHGEAQLALNEACLVFIAANADGIDEVTAMAQGHYSIVNDASGTPRLSASHNMPHLLGSAADAAVVKLAGKQLSEARALILGARP